MEELGIGLIFFIVLILIFILVGLFSSLNSVHRDVLDVKKNLSELKRSLLDLGQKIEGLPQQQQQTQSEVQLENQKLGEPYVPEKAREVETVFEDPEINQVVYTIPPPPPSREQAKSYEAVVPPPIPEHAHLAAEAKKGADDLSTSLLLDDRLEQSTEGVLIEAPLADAPKAASTASVQPKNTPRKKSWLEALLTENTLSKIGIITLVLGIGFFVKYAIDKNWINEIGRVGIGLLTGGLLIGIAHSLRNKYNVFSSILVGGGIAVFYITITLAFREYELFSQTVAFILLIVVTVFSVLLSLLYDRKELAIFSLLGGFAAPLMVSTGGGNYVVLFAYLLILNTGMLVLSYIKNWRVLGVISYLLSVFFIWSWLLSSYKDEYVGVSIFVSLFFAQFYVLAIFDHLKSGYKITPFQVLLILSNNVSAFIAFLYIYNDFDYDVRGIITIVQAVVNAFVLIFLFGKSQIDKNLLYLIIAVVLTFVSLAIPIQLNGHVITMFWAAEMCILLMLWQKSRIKVFFVAFVLISIHLLISYAMDLVKNYIIYSHKYLPVVTNPIFITGLVVIASFVLCIFLLKREKPGTEVQFVNLGLTINLRSVIRIFKLLVIFFAYLVPFFELNHQLQERFGIVYNSLRYFNLATYTYAYIAGLCAVYFKNTMLRNVKYGLLLFSYIAYAYIYVRLTAYVRYDIFVFERFTDPNFLFHLIGFLSICFIGYYLAVNSKSQRIAKYAVMSWIVAIVSVVILSVEMDNLIILFFGNSRNYASLLYDSHTFGYPILWSVIGMICMVWGLKAKEVVLRQIALFFFGVTIVKFYAYDVWFMSQVGRVISFVILGVILLVVSFLQQKIKVLVKKDNQLVEENEDAN